MAYIRKIKTGYRAEVSLGYTASGKKISKSQVFKTKREAKEWADHIEISKELGFNSNLDSRTLLVSIIPIYLEHIKTYKYNTYINYKSDIENKFLKYFKHYPIGKITSSKLKEFIELQKELYAPRTVSRLLGVIKDFYSFIETERAVHLPDNPTRAIKRINITNEKKFKYWDVEDVKYFLENCKTHVNYDIFKLIIHTGLRPNEALSLVVDDYDSRNRILHISKQIQKSKAEKGLYLFGELKNENPRSVPIGDVAAEILERASDGKDKNDFIFQTKLKIPKNAKRLRIIDRKRSVVNAYFITTTTISTAFKEMAEDHGLPNITTHGLRHTFASHFVMNGGSITALQKILGHKKIDNTMIYAHLSKTHMDGVRNLVQF